MPSLRRWPPSGGAPRGALGDSTKEASAPPSLALPELAGRVVGSIRKYSADMPPGIDKVAALRNGVEEITPPTPDTIWRHPQASPAVLTLMLLDRYGEEYAEWEPEALLGTLKKDGIETSQPVRTKILASRVCLISPSPWRQWEAFHWVCRGLAGEPPNFVYLEEPEMGHLVVGIEFMQMVDPEREPGWDVDKFIAATFRHEGVPYLPPPLDFAQAELEQRQLECQNCEALHRDDNDQRCVTCGSPRLSPVPYEHADLRDRVRALWDQCRTMPLEQAVEVLPEDAAGTATYRLLVHWDYAHQVRAQTATQLRMMGSR